MTGTFFKQAYAACIAMGALGLAGSTAHAVVYQVSWVGASGYTLDGTMSFDDTLLGTGAIDETDIDSLAFDGFHNGSLIGSWDLVVDGLSAGANFNFNFDTTSETFVTGGHAASPAGQQWNTSLCTVSLAFGYFSGNATQGFCLTDGTMVGMIPVADSTLTATRIEDGGEIGEAASLALAGLGLAGFGAIAGRRRRCR